MTAPTHLTMNAQPDGMKVATLGQVCTFKYGKSLAAKDRTGSGNPVYGSNGVVGFHDGVQTDGPAIVIGRKGSYGEVNFASEACWPIDTTYFIDRTCTDLNLEWLKHLLPTLGLNTMNRSAAVPGLNREDAYRIPIAVPSPGEQRRIATILDKADELRSKRRLALAELDSLIESIFHSMFGDPVRNERGWDSCLVSDFISDATGGKNIIGSVDEAGGYRVLKISAITSLRFLAVETKPLPAGYVPPARHLLRNGDLLFSRANTSELVGATVLVREAPENFALPDKIWRLEFGPGLPRPGPAPADG